MTGRVVYPSYGKEVSRSGTLVWAGMAMWGVLGLSGVMTLFLVPWHLFVVICIGGVLSIACLLLPCWGSRSLFFLVPFTTATLYLWIRADWNFVVGDKAIDLIPMFAPVVPFAVAGFLLRKWSRLERDVPENSIRVPIWILYVYSGLTILWSESQSHSLFQFIVFSLNIGIFYLIHAYIRDEADLSAAVWCFILSGILQALSHWIWFFMESYQDSFRIFSSGDWVIKIPGGYFQPSGMPMVDGGFMDHHELALFLNLAVALSFGQFLTGSSRRNRWILAGAILLFFQVILHTQSRGGVGGLVLVVITATIAFHDTRRYVIRFVPVCLIALAGLYLCQAMVIGSITGKTTIPRLLALGKKMAESRNVIDPGLKEKRGRLVLWKKSFKAYAGKPVTGLGIGNLKKKSNAPHAHSIVLSFLFDFGIVGLFILFWICGVLWKQFAGAFRKQATYSEMLSVAIGVGFTALGFHGQFDFEYNTPLVWVYLGLATAAFRIANRKTRESVLRIRPATGEGKAVLPRNVAQPGLFSK